MVRMEEMVRMVGMVRMEGMVEDGEDGGGGW